VRELCERKHSGAAHTHRKLGSTHKCFKCLFVDKGIDGGLVRSGHREGLFWLDYILLHSTSREKQRLVNFIFSLWSFQ
jgi:hypothetical protein